MRRGIFVPFTAATDRFNAHGKAPCWFIDRQGAVLGFGRMLRDFPMGFSVGNRGAGPLYGTAG